MRFTDISVVLALSAVAVAAPHPDGEKSLYKVGTSPRYILARGPGEKVFHKGGPPQLLARDDEVVLHKAGSSHLLARQSSGETGSAGNSDTCYGSGVTCASCFGTNWVECPDGVTCYDKTDPTSTCSSSSGGSSSGGSAGGSDTCSGVGATCVSCFGSGYLECSDGHTCYNPADPTTSCPDGTSGTGSGSGSSTGGAGSGLIGSSTTSTAAGSAATTGGAGSVATTHAPSSTTSHSSTSSTSTASTSAATTAPSPISGNKVGSAVGISIPMGLSAGAGAAVLVAAALM